MKERNNAFDLLCGICIIRMVTLHITNSCGFGNESWWTPIMDWSYYFMSFFFFKAGYFNKTISGNTKEFISKKFKQLMIPYFVWGMIGNIVYFFFAIFILDPKNSMVKDIKLEHIWLKSQFYGNVPCWFLFSFFVAYVSSHLMSKVPTLFRIPIPDILRWHHHKVMVNIKIHWVILLFPYISWWLWSKDNPLWLELNNVFMGIYLFYLGRLWHFIMEKIGNVHTAILSALMIGMFIYINVIYGGRYSMVDNVWKGNFVPVISGVTLALCGISGLLLSTSIPRIPVINYIGQHSMVFFVLHYPIMILYKMIRSANVKSLKGNWDDYTILLLVIFSICFLLVPHIEKVSWLSGRFKKKDIPLTYNNNL